MGGRSTVGDEVLCRFTFPERPGALMNFLDSFSPRWNITLFHYRGQVCFPFHHKNVLMELRVSSLLYNLPSFKKGWDGRECAGRDPSPRARNGGI